MELFCENTLPKTKWR